MPKSFSPVSRQQSERSIQRLQKTFDAGVFMDIPPANVPDNGVCYLKNYVNKGNELVGRSGSRKWGDYATGTAAAALPSFATGISATSTSTGTVRTIAISSGYSFTTANIGDFFVHDNGIHERITNVVSASSITTDTDSATAYTSTAARLRYQINGQYFHKFLKKIIIQIGQLIYISDDVVISGWSLAYNESFEDLDNSISTFDEHGNYILIFNAAGIYRLDLNASPTVSTYYYKINSQVPQEQLTGVAEVVGVTVHCRRYIYGYGKLSGSGQNRDRQTDGVIQQIDSGTNILNTQNIDYAEYWSEYNIDVSSGNIVTPLDVSLLPGLVYKENHWDVYTIWATADTENTATNDQAFIWVADVPIMKSFIVTIDVISGTVLSGEILRDDINSTIRIYSGGTVYERTIMTVDETTNTFTIDSSVPSVSNTYAHIGALSGGIISIDTGNKTLTVTTGSMLTTADIGKRLFLSDGSTVHIIAVDTGVATITETKTLAGTISACWDITSRSFFDETNDATLIGRISGYPCYQRFYEALPNADIGVATAGFIFTASRNDNNVYYSELSEGFDFLSGYYHPAYQTTFVKDGIRLLKSMPDAVVIYSYGSTSIIKTNTYSETILKDLGVVIATVTSQTVVDENIGCIAYDSVRSMEDGTHILVTNEPGIRVFNGVRYSDNLASQRIVEILKTFQPFMSSIYHPTLGYIFWGLSE